MILLYVLYVSGVNRIKYNTYCQQHPNPWAFWCLMTLCTTSRRPRRSKFAWRPPGSPSFSNLFCIFSFTLKLINAVKCFPFHNWPVPLIYWNAITYYVHPIRTTNFRRTILTLMPFYGFDSNPSSHIVQGYSYPVPPSSDFCRCVAIVLWLPVTWYYLVRISEIGGRLTDSPPYQLLNRQYADVHPFTKGYLPYEWDTCLVICRIQYKLLFIMVGGVDCKNIISHVP